VFLQDGQDVLSAGSQRPVFSAPVEIVEDFDRPGRVADHQDESICNWFSLTDLVLIQRRISHANDAVLVIDKLLSLEKSNRIKAKTCVIGHIIVIASCEFNNAVATHH